MLKKVLWGLAVMFGVFALSSQIASASHGRGNDMSVSIDASGRATITVTQRLNGSCTVGVTTGSISVKISGGTSAANAESAVESGSQLSNVSVPTICSRTLGTSVAEQSGSLTVDLTAAPYVDGSSNPYAWYGFRHQSGAKVSGIVNSGDNSSATSWSVQSVVQFRSGQVSGSPALATLIPLAMNPQYPLSQVLTFNDPDGGTTSARTLCCDSNPPSAPDYSVVFDVITDGNGQALTANAEVPGNTIRIPANVSGFTTSSDFVEFKIRVFDAEGEYSEYNYVIVPSTNIPPTITRTGGGGFTLTMNDGTTSAFTDLQATDSNAGQTVTFSLGSAPSWVTLAQTSGTTASAQLNFAPVGIAPGAYSFSLNATDNDSSSPLTTSQTITVTIPEAPVVTAGDTTVSATWSAPQGVNNITAYQLRIRTSSDNGQTWGSYTLSPTVSAAPPFAYTFTGLTNGDLYEVQYGWEISNGGTITWSPTGLAFSRPGTSQTITWTNPGSVAINTSGDPGASTSSGLPVAYSSSTIGVCRVQGDGVTVDYLTQGTCTLTATAAGGTVNGTTYLAAPSVTESFSVSSVSAPAAPTITSIVFTDRVGSIVFTAGSNGGSAITNYDVSFDGGTTWVSLDPAQTSSPISVSVSTWNTSYQIRIRARNSVGVGSQSNLVQAVSGREPGGLLTPPVGSTPTTDVPDPTDPPQDEAPETPETPEPPMNRMPEPVVDAPEPGESFVTEDGVATPAVFQRTQGSSWSVQGDGFSFELTVNETGPDAPRVETDGTITMISGRGFEVSGLGYFPNTLVDVWAVPRSPVTAASQELMPQSVVPIYLGTVTTNADGTFRGLLAVPPSVSIGEYTLQTNGTTADGQYRTMNTPLRIIQPMTMQLPITGRDDLGATVAWFFLIAGFGLFWSARRRAG